MADGVGRLVRDGVVAGEQAPAVLVRDSLETHAGPAIFKHFFTSLCANIVAGRAQAKGLVTVALSSTPESYPAVFESETSGSSPTSWLQVVDCYTDPLGWNEMLESKAEGHEGCCQPHSAVCHDIHDLSAFLSTLLKSGQAAVNQQRKAHFAVLIDSMSLLLRYHSLPALANFLNTLRSHEQVSALVWLVHADLHEPRVVAALEYMATVVVYVEPPLPLHSVSQETRHQGDIKPDTIQRGRMRVRHKRRNGRVREQAEEFLMELSGVTFTPLTLMKEIAPLVTTKGNTPKVQFNLRLTEKEQEDRAKVVLPFEHQGDGKELHIYDGRKDPAIAALGDPSLAKGGYQQLGAGDRFAVTVESSAGEIHYLRDSDDEHPDSDEDPDDDLDI